MKLNVTCDQCNKGKLYLPEGYDGLADHYTIHCENEQCQNVFTVHYTGMDNILSEHTYANEVKEDVKILNTNGSWYGEGGMFKQDKFDELTRDMKLIQKIECDFTYYYYQEGADFYMISEMPYGGAYNIAKYRAKSNEAVGNLINHFFKKTA